MRPAAEGIARGCAALLIVLTGAVIVWLACCEHPVDNPMKLFYAPGSSSLLPHIVLHEAAIPFDPIKIDEHTKSISGGAGQANS
jgi:hypothetical protein